MICRIGLIALTVLQITGLTSGLCGDDPCSGCGGTTSSCCNSATGGFDPGLADSAYPQWIQDLLADPGSEAIPSATATLCVAYRTDAHNDHPYGNSYCLSCHGPDPAGSDQRIQGSCCGFPLSTYTLTDGQYLIYTDPTPVPATGTPTAAQLQMEYYLAKLTGGNYVAKANDLAVDQYISNQCTGTVDPTNPNLLQTPTYLGFVLKDWCSDNIQKALDAATTYQVDGENVQGILYSFVHP